MENSEPGKSSLMLATKKCHFTLGRLACIELLKSGHVDAFHELFDLIQMNRRIRKEAEDRGERHLQKLLEDNSEYLQYLCSALKEAEEARKMDSASVEYETRMKVGDHFGQNETDFWLAEHFYDSCYHVIEKSGSKDDHGMVRALERLGCINELRGDIDKAHDLLDQASNYAVEHDVVMSDSKIRHELDLDMYRVCMKLGQRCVDRTADDKFVESEPCVQEALKFFDKAFKHASSADTVGSQAAVQGKIGILMNRLKNYDQAVKHFTEALMYFKRAGDISGMCNGYIALASVYEDMDNLEEALSTLARCRFLAVQSGQPEVLLPCCISMGRVYTSLADFKRAAEQYANAYELLPQCEDKFEDYAGLSKYVRYLCGVGKAHVYFCSFVRNVADTSPESLAKLFS